MRQAYMHVIRLFYRFVDSFWGRFVITRHVKYIDVLTSLKRLLGHLT